MRDQYTSGRVSRPTFVKQTSVGYSKSPLVPLHDRVVVIWTWSFLSDDVAVYFDSAEPSPLVSTIDIGVVSDDGNELWRRELGKSVPR